MLLYAVIAVLVLVAVAIAVPLLRRSSPLDDVNRFHVARTLTTSWSDQWSEQHREPSEQADP